MKRTLLHFQYSRLLGLHRKLNKRLQKHFAARRFHQFTKAQQHKLLIRIERLKAKLSLLDNQAKLTGVALLVGTALHITDATAQFAAKGANFMVNVDTITTINNVFPSVAADSAGDFVVTWSSNNEATNNPWGIYAQRYNAAGVAQGSEFLVSSAYTAYSQIRSAVAMDAGGDFVITWVIDAGSYGIMAKRYNAAGVAQGSEFLVATITGGYQNATPPSVAMDSKGDFVITWQMYNPTANYDIYARRYNAAGVAQDTSFLVNTDTTSIQQRPSVAMDSQGDFIITWQGPGKAGANNGYDIYAQRYDSFGAALGANFLVNTYTTGQQMNPSIAMDSEGDFVIAWMSVSDSTPSSYAIHAQRYNAAGVGEGQEFQVNNYTTGQQFYPSVAMDSQGDFAISWANYDTVGSFSIWDIFARVYNAAGVAQGSEFLVNTYPIGLPVDGANTIAMDSRGDFIIAWENIDEAHPSSYLDIYAQRYVSDSASITAVTSQTGASLFNLYPNPAQGQVQITLNGDAYVRVMDMTGHVLIEQPLQGNTLNIGNLNAGMYMVEVTQNGATDINKLIVQQ